MCSRPRVVLLGVIDMKQGEKEGGVDNGVTVDGINILLVGKVAFVISVVVTPVDCIVGSVAFVEYVAGLDEDEPMAKSGVEFVVR